CSTSGRTALRVRMECLLERGNAPLNLLQGRTDAGWCCASGNIVAPEDRIQGDRRIKILIELRTELPELLERQIAKLAALLQTMAHSFSDDLVSRTEGNPLSGKIRRRCHGIHESQLRGGAHACEIELAAAHYAGSVLQGLDRRCRRIEDWLLRLLQILVVGQR